MRAEKKPIHPYYFHCLVGLITESACLLGGLAIFQALDVTPDIFLWIMLLTGLPLIPIVALFCWLIYDTNPKVSAALPGMLFGGKVILAAGGVLVPTNVVRLIPPGYLAAGWLAALAVFILGQFLGLLLSRAITARLEKVYAVRAISIRQVARRPDRLI